MPHKTDTARAFEATKSKKELLDWFTAEGRTYSPEKQNFLLKLFCGTKEELQEIKASLLTLEDNAHEIPAEMRIKVIARQRGKIYHNKSLGNFKLG